MKISTYVALDLTLWVKMHRKSLMCYAKDLSFCVPLRVASFFALILDSIRETFGTPARLLRLLAERPAIRIPVGEAHGAIDAGGVVPWHEWGSHASEQESSRVPARLKGWRNAGGRYVCFEASLPALAMLGQHRISANWTCDIGDVQGLAAAPSDLSQFSSLDDMVERACPELIDEISAERLLDNLGHPEIQIFHAGGGESADHFARYLWDDRVFLINQGGGHQFAAGRYIAARLGEPVPLEGALHIYSLNPISLGALSREFEIFLIRDTSEISNAFFGAMRSFNASYLWYDMQYAKSNSKSKSKAILLPRKDVRSMRVARALRERGVVDLGQYLIALCKRQAVCDIE